MTDEVVPRADSRALRIARDHPWWTSGIVGALLPVLATALVGLAAWGLDFIDTVPRAKEREAALRHDLEQRMSEASIERSKTIETLAGAIASNTQTLRLHSDADARTNAGYALSAMRAEVRDTATWVNLCRGIEGRNKTPQEMQMCYRFDREEADAKRRYESAQIKAENIWGQR